MRVVFRTEGSHKQGMGDVWGSIALADECAKQKDEILFIVSGGEVAISAVEDYGYRFHAADSFAGEQKILRAFRPDVIIINKLTNPPEYIRSLREFGGLIVTIDDCERSAKHADIKINILYHIAGAVTDPRYICLRKEFHEVHGWTKEIRIDAREMLVTQGGSDTYGFTPKIVRSLEQMAWRPHCTIVVGPAFRHEDELAKAVQDSRLDLTVVRNARNMGDLMWDADLAITAGGITMFELACVGTPSVVVCGEPFEEETAERLAQAGIVVHLGFGERLDYTQIPKAVDALVKNRKARVQMSKKGKDSVDGRGCERIIKLIRERVEKRAPAVVS